MMIDIKEAKVHNNSDSRDYIGQIFQKYIPDMYKIAKSRLYNDDDIYDAIQETGYKLFTNIEKIKKLDSIKIWLIKVLINECNRIYRRKKKEEKLQEKIAITKLKEIESDYQNSLEFATLINGLKKEDKTILTLYYGNNLTTKDISKILNKNENTIRTRILRAKEYLKSNLDKEEI